MNKIKYAVVGLHRGQGHVNALKVTPHAQCVAVADLDFDLAKEVALKNSIPCAYASLDELLEKSDCNAVILATPIPDHADHVCKVLAAGKHVLSEVTCATKMEDLTRIQKAVGESGKKYMLAENYVWIRAWTIVRNLVKAGLLGEIYYAESDYLMDFQCRPGFPKVAQKWREEVYFGRQGHPYITHTLGPLAHLMGEKITSVSAMSAGRQYDLPADNTVVLMMKTEKDHMIVLRNQFVGARPDSYTYYSIQGTKGAYVAPQGPTDFHKIHIKGLCKPNEWKNLFDIAGFLPAEWDMYKKDWKAEDAHDDGTSMYDSGCALMDDEFALSILNDTQPPISLDEALNWTAAGLLSEESVNNGSNSVKVPLYND